MNSKNNMKLQFDSRSENESFARVTVAAFLTQLNPTMEEVEDVKMAVSEAVTNSIIHGYESEIRDVKICCRIEEGSQFVIIVSDEGYGIPDIKKAMEPLYTSKPELERSGMGFAFMEAFMDEIKVDSELGKGTTVTMKKVIGRESKFDSEE